MKFSMEVINPKLDINPKSCFTNPDVKDVCVQLWMHAGLL
jgi:hypothetical protein